MSTSISSFIALIYPPLCLHCEAPLPHQFNLFCPLCSGHFKFTDIEKHCRKCFSPLKELDLVQCSKCRARSSPFQRAYAPFYQTPELSTYLQHIKRRSTSYLSKSGASWIVLKALQNEFIYPDLIIPVPHSKKISHLAYSIAAIYSRPLVQALKMHDHMFKLNEKYASLCEDKHLMLITDTILPSPHLYLAGKSLLGAHPRSITLLSLAAELPPQDV